MSHASAGERPLGELVSPRQKWLILISLVVCTFISGLDASIVATATPRVIADLGGFDLLSWVFTVYLLTSTISIPIFGKLSDMFGRKVFLLVGIAIFTAASVACGAAPSMLFLVGARAVQGIGGGMIMACVFAVLGDLLTPIERAKYFAFFAGAGTVASVTGPTFGGFLADGPGWRWCFFINLPVCAVAATFISLNLPMKRKPGRLASIDFLGAALLSGATTSLLLGLVWAQDRFGWAAPETIGLLATSAILTAGFIVQEGRHPQAMLPLHLFRNPVFVTANALSIFLSMSMAGAVTYLPTFIQTSLGASATSSGIVSTPQSLAMLTASFLGGQVMARTGRFKYQAILGGVLVVIATVLMQTLDVGVPKWHISVFVVLFGLGNGLILPTMSVVVQSCVTQEHMGVASSSRMFFMQIGSVLGAAIFGVVLASSYSSAFSSELTRRADLPDPAFAALQDPTLALNKRELAQVQTEVLAVPDGQAVLDDALRSQREAVATAIHHVFLGATLAAAIALLFAIATREIPLRRSFGAAPATSPPAKEPSLEPASS